MQLEQVRDAADIEAVNFEQSILGKRMGRKRKAPSDEEVGIKLSSNNFSLNNNLLS